MMFVFIIIVIDEGYWIERAVKVLPNFPVIFISCRVKILTRSKLGFD